MGEPSISKSAREEEILTACEPLVLSLGFRIVDLDVREAGRSLVRLFIDYADAKPASVSVEDCATISRTLSPTLDASITSAYDLEVSSAGLDRRLRLRRDFENSLGERVKLKLIQKTKEGAQNLTGKLARVDNGNITVEVDAKEVEVPLEHVVLAVRVWQPQSQ